MSNTALQIANELSHTLELIDQAEIQALSQLLADASAVFGAGAGRSGCMIKAPLMRLMHMGVPTYVIGEISTPAAHPGDVLLMGSGSGQTATLMAIATKAKKLGMRIALITIDKDCQLGKLSDVVVQIPAPTPKMENGGIGSSIQPMGSLFEQAMLLILDSVIMDVMDKKQIDAKKMFGRHANLE